MAEFEKYTKRPGLELGIEYNVGELAFLNINGVKFSIKNTDLYHLSEFFSDACREGLSFGVIKGKNKEAGVRP